MTWPDRQVTVRVAHRAQREPQRAQAMHPPREAQAIVLRAPG